MGGIMSSYELTRDIIGAAIEVHKHPGPGLLESAYEECLAYELVAESRSDTEKSFSPWNSLFSFPLWNSVK